MRARRVAGLLVWAAVAAYGLAWCVPAQAQAAAGCGAKGYRVIASEWDAVLRRSWELRQDCIHPDWPARLAAGSESQQDRNAWIQQAPPSPRPLAVHAGEPVRLWMQDGMVRIEMSGVTEQSARVGERVLVRVTRQSDEAGLTVERIGGVVRGAGDVEMER